MSKLATRTCGAFIVTRVSTGEQDKNGTSPETQLEMCRAKAAQLGLPLIAEFYDAAISGALLISRVGMQAALAGIREGRGDTLICPNIDRYSRDEEYQHHIRKAVRAAGGRLVLCDIDFAAYERKVIRKRSVRGKLKKVEQGIQPARGMRPFGYRCVTTQDVLRGEQPLEMAGKYLVMEEEVRWALEMFARYAAGSSLTKLARWLQEYGVIPIRGAKIWHANTLVGILRNPIYKGQATYGKRKRTKGNKR